jgi:tetratricopeptide (TPR) repeat protein
MVTFNKISKGFFAKGGKLAKKAFALDKSLATAHTILGQVYILRRDWENSIAEAQRAIELDPNAADSYWYLGAAFVFAGRPEEAIQALKIAIRLNPFTPGHYLYTLAMAYSHMDRHEEAIE